MSFDAIDPGSIPAFVKRFFLPFQISYCIVKAFSIEIKEIIKKLELKHWGRCREAVYGRWHTFKNLN